MVNLVQFYDLAGHFIESVTASANPNNVRDALYIEDELVGVVDQALNVGAETQPFLRGIPQRLPPAGWLLLLAGSGVTLLLLAKPSRRPVAGTAAVTLLAILLLEANCGGPAPAVFSWVHTDYIGKPLDEHTAHR